MFDNYSKEELIALLLTNIGERITLEIAYHDLLAIVNPSKTDKINKATKAAAMNTKAMEIAEIVSILKSKHGLSDGDLEQL